MTKQSRTNLVDQIKLVSIEPVKLDGFPAGVSVTLHCDQKRPTLRNPIRTGEVLNATFTYSADQVVDDGIVSVARADFHDLVEKLAAATTNWALTPKQREAFETQSARQERELNERGISLKLGTSE